MHGPATSTADADRVEEELCWFEGRVAGSDAERRAANRLVRRLERTGRAARIEPIYIQTPWAGAHAVHCLLGVAGSIVAITLAPLGFALVLAAATSMYLDLHGRRYLIRRLAFRRASQNVLSPAPRSGGDGGRVILCANYDAPRTGAAYQGRLRRGWRLLAGRGGPIGPFRLLFWALALLLVPIGARMAGLDNPALDLAQLPSTVILLVGAFLLGEIELSQPGPGANDNASGVAAAVAAAERLSTPPLEQIRVDLLLTGGGEALGAGMRAFLRSRRAELDPERTWFIALDSVGEGPLRYETAAGWIVGFGMDRRLIELCEAIAAADEERAGAPSATPWRSAGGTESLLPVIAGYRAIGISRRDEHGLAPRGRSAADIPDLVDPDAVEAAAGFVEELVRQLDRDAARRARAAGPPT